MIDYNCNNVLIFDSRDYTINWIQKKIKMINWIKESIDPSNFRIIHGESMDCERMTILFHHIEDLHLCKLLFLELESA